MAVCVTGRGKYSAPTEHKVHFIRSTQMAQGTLYKKHHHGIRYTLCTAPTEHKLHFKHSTHRAQGTLYTKHPQGTRKDKSLNCFICFFVSFFLSLPHLKLSPWRIIHKILRPFYKHGQRLIFHTPLFLKDILKLRNYC